MLVKTSLQHQLTARPWWMQLLFAFSIFMTFVYLPWDVLIKPLEEDQEVWFGLLFTGWFAKLGGLLHWLVYGAATFGYLKMKSWMYPWSVIYLLQIALGMLVWSLTGERGGGMAGSFFIASLFLLIAYLSWRERGRFGG
ncbi:MAG TPA: hypothetical protein DEF79_11570 [Gammaproteobacteria bacterium]|nr:hypothetical protein [Gammaproteobacteria bacterium]|tara:strand:+ start:13934 stop:14350 length:417 start_codon:yes stop_codon:yes gene_type:complete